MMTRPCFRFRPWLAVYAVSSLLAVLMAAGCGGAANGPAWTQAESGDSFENAMPMGSIGEQLDVMNGTSCGGDGFFRKTHVEVVSRDGRHYDVVNAACTSGDETRKFYFDVSGCFPCPD